MDKKLTVSAKGRDLISHAWQSGRISVIGAAVVELNDHSFPYRSHFDRTEVEMRLLALVDHCARIESEAEEFLTQFERVVLNHPIHRSLERELAKA